MTALLLALALQVQAGAGPAYSGAAGAVRVEPPRIETSVRIDGQLDEPVWSRAARLTDFSQYSPADGRPAVSRTEALVWYSPTALHFGIRAYADAEAVRAHLADRDQGILADDYVEIHLGTFNDGRQAFVFAVNPLGIQADGSLLEGSRQRHPGYGGESSGREQADLSPDFTFDSRGRVTDAGFEVEVRIPFRSLRYPSAERQDWSLQIVRRAAASGREDTWAPARRAAPSFLAQGGTLVGLHGLSRGLVLEMNPIVTSTVEGARPAEGDAWRYEGGRPEPGGNVRWGLSTNLTLNGTVNPDFSQVESDAGQVTSDPRRALFFAEKRPFFLDGLEYFATPNQLIYTRRIGLPVAAVKITGKASGTSFGLLSAVDGRPGSATGRDNPVFNVIRIQRDVAGQSRIGVAYTDRIDGDDFNRVAQVDGRLVLSPLYNVSFYGAVSRTRAGDVTTTAPMWSADLVRTGRTVGMQASFRAVSDRFQAQSGFISQGDIAEVSLAPSLTLYGGTASLVQRFTAMVFGQLVWPYAGFRAGDPALDRRLLIRANSTLRGGWEVGLTTYHFNYGFDERLYRGFGLEMPAAQGTDTVPYLPGGRVGTFAYSLIVNSPEVSGFRLQSYIAGGKDMNYDEFSAARVWLGNVTLGYRPTGSLRLEAKLPFSSYERWSDGSLVARTLIPRLKVEYQVSRSVFLRVVGEYRAVRRDSLRDDTRTERPILIRNADSVYTRDAALAFQRNDVRVDFLFSFQPTPGTVFFAGYGSTMAEDEAFRFKGLRRSRDAFFTKLSYLFRL